MKNSVIYNRWLLFSIRCRVQHRFCMISNEKNRQLYKKKVKLNLDHGSFSVVSPIIKLPFGFKGVVNGRFCIIEMRALTANSLHF